jgi:hypothetical protein
LSSASPETFAAFGSAIAMPVSDDINTQKKQLDKTAMAESDVAD